ncbi:TRAFAC clade GTPase domain-containing protein [Streptosporangium sp. NPDC004631]
MWLFAFIFVAWLLAIFIGVFAAMTLFPLVLLGSTLVAAGLYLTQAWAILVPDVSGGPSPVAQPVGGKEHDPAYRHYLASQVWKDWQAILRNTTPLIGAKAEAGLRKVTSTLLGGEQAWFLFPIWLGICGGIVAAAVPVLVIGALIMALYMGVVALGTAVWLICVGVLRAIEQVFMLVHRILQTCPYPECYARFTLPVYRCSNCGTKHRRLTPNLNGAARHVCRCGTRLPTTILLGRYRLQAYCPNCDRQLPTRVGRVRIEPIPFVGGPDAGKTTFMALAVNTVHSAVNTAGGTALFADKGDEKAFQHLRRELATGRISKTLNGMPKAVMLDVAMPGRSRGSRILYLFDPSGEHYTGASKVEEMRFLAHGEALILVIDPFALPGVRDNLLEFERRALETRGVVLSPEDPADTFTRLRNELAGRADGGSQRRVAVVLTKADLLRTTTSGRGIDDLPGWLTLMGLGNLVREVAHQSAEVRYLASGLPPRGPEIAELMGWLAGLRLSGAAEESSWETAELTAGDARRPWDVKPRPTGCPPLSYLLFRRTLAGATMVTSTLVLALLSMLLLRLWVTGDDSTALEAATASTLPQTLPVPSTKTLAGHWRGTVHQPGSGQYRVDLVLTKKAWLGEKAGTVEYPGLKCSGTVTLEPVNDPVGTTVVREEITKDTGRGCAPLGWIALNRTLAGKLGFRWFKSFEDIAQGGSPAAYATLTKKP